MEICRTSMADPTHCWERRAKKKKKKKIYFVTYIIIEIIRLFFFLQQTSSLCQYKSLQFRDPSTLTLFFCVFLCVIQVTDLSTSSWARALTPLSKVCKQKVSKPKWLKWVFQFNVERPLYVCCMDIIYTIYYTLIIFKTLSLSNSIYQYNNMFFVLRFSLTTIIFVNIISSYVHIVTYI